MIEFLPPNLHQLDLHLIQYGIEQCKSKHSFGPAMREYYKFHFILSGKGMFQIGGNTYFLHAGQGFLITPGEITYYEADQNEPWHYCWIGFDGIKAETLLKQANLSSTHPIIHCNENDFFLQCIDDMTQSKEMGAGREVKLTGLLYLWLSKCIEHQSPQDFKPSLSNKEHYSAEVIRFIEMNYANSISIGHIAEFIGLDRSYLGSLFKEVTGTNIQDHLIRYRLRKACELLSHTACTVGDIARSVGYEDPLLFSKMFKKHIKQTPSEYRSQSQVH